MLKSSLCCITFIYKSPHLSSIKNRDSILSRWHLHIYRLCKSVSKKIGVQKAAQLSAPFFPQAVDYLVPDTPRVGVGQKGYLYIFSPIILSFLRAKDLIIYNHTDCNMFYITTIHPFVSWSCHHKHSFSPHTFRKIFDKFYLSV